MSVSTMIRISLEAKDRLDELRHPGQSYDGIIKELLKKAEPPPRTKKRINTGGNRR